MAETMWRSRKNMSIPSVDRTQSRHYGDSKQRYFSVSSICAAMTGEHSYGSEADMQRGTDLHTIFALAVASFAGRCAPPVVPIGYQDSYQSMRLWIERWKPEPVLIEHPSVSAIRGLPFAGTPDLLAWTTGKWPGAQDGRVLTLIDLKTGVRAPWHMVQVQAYHKLKGYQEATALRLLYINEFGGEPTYLPVKKDPRDFAAFQSALNLLLWRESV